MTSAQILELLREIERGVQNVAQRSCTGATPVEIIDLCSPVINQCDDAIVALFASAVGYAGPVHIEWVHPDDER
jgi:hypothetical protein